MEKGFGFIARKNGGDDAHVHAKQCNGLTLVKDMCVSFVYEDSDKGPAAKDVREEDPARVARVTAKVLYGKIEVGFPFLLSDFPLALSSTLLTSLSYASVTWTPQTVILAAAMVSSSRSIT